MNPYKMLVRLLPGRPLLAGEVTDYADGMATIQTVDGGLWQARGVATIGDQVYFREGAIEGPAPDLPEDTIEV